MWEGASSFHALCHSSCISTESPTPKLSEPHPFVFFWRPHYIGMIKSWAIGDWIQFPTPFPSLEGEGWGWKDWKFLGSFHWLPASTLRLPKDFPKVTLLTQQKHLDHPQQLGSYKVLGALCQEQGQRSNIYSSYYESQYHIWTCWKARETLKHQGHG